MTFRGAKKFKQFLETNNFIFFKTIIYRCEEQLFLKTIILKIKNDKIKKFAVFETKRKYYRNSTFRNFRSIYFHAQNNLFDCIVAQCGINSLLLDG
uniref:Uncharacterized protein n=1 Tax=Wuchereria bancrofti TaxID=6293 RepID=A0A1I8EJC5_WUCBA